MSELNRPDANLFTPEKFGSNEILLLRQSTDGPVIEKLGSGKSPLEKDAVPAEKLSPSERMLLESLPALPEKDTKVCAPLTKEQEEKFAGKIIGLCNYKDIANLSDDEKNKYREQRRLHLNSRDSVAKTPDGNYLIIKPMPDFK